MTQSCHCTGDTNDKIVAAARKTSLTQIGKWNLNAGGNRPNSFSRGMAMK